MTKIIRVGVFDSGIGGLSVLHRCKMIFPRARYYYWGDNQFAPYGNRSGEEIFKRSLCAMNAFLSVGVDAVILACNTVTALCIDELRSMLSIPIIGIEPAVLPASRECRNVLILATMRTLESERLHELISRTNNCRFSLFFPEHLVEKIECLVLKGETFDLARHLPRGTYDGIVLGCTHYSHVKKGIADFYRAKTYDGNDGVAKRLSFLFCGDEEPLLGTADHLDPVSSCFVQKTEKETKNDIIFLGDSKNLNEFAYKRLFYEQAETGETKK